jgi:mercuric ion transport protein
MNLRKGINGISQMRVNKLLQVGVIGTVLTALYCFMPILDLGLGTVGLVAAMAWLDVPCLGIFLCLSAYAVCRQRRNS